MKLVIRKAELKDTVALIDIFSSAVQYKLEHKDKSWSTESYSEREVRGLIKTDGMYLVSVGNEIVGTFALSWADKRIWGERPADAGYIHRLATKHTYHGKGLGKEILDWAATEVRKAGKQYLRLDCDARNEKLCTYYEQQGFKDVGDVLIPSDKDYYANLYECVV